MNNYATEDADWYDSHYVKWSVGLVVLLSAGMLVVALVMVGQLDRWFAGETTIRLNLPQDGAFGLRAGDPVRVLGTRAGTVLIVDVEHREGEPAVLYAEVSLRDAFLPFVSDDSEAIIHKELGIAGETYVQITRTTGSLTGDPPVLNTTADRSALALLEEAMGNIQENVLPAIERLSKTVETLSGGGDGMGVAATIDRIGSIARKIDEGEGVLGQLVTSGELADRVQNVAEQASQLADRAEPVLGNARTISEDAQVIAEQLREELPGLVDQLEQTLEQARGMVGGVSDATAGAPRLVDTVQRAAEQLPTTLIQLQTTLTEMEDLLDALQESWLIEGGASEPRRLTPEEVAP